MRFGVAASLFAVWCQVVFLAIAWMAAPAPFAASSADPLAGVPICHAGGGAAPATPDHQAPPAHDCSACVLCVAVGSHAWAPPLSAPFALPTPGLAAVARYVTARPRAPPAVFLVAAQPRGPPRLI
ncbi:MAG: DUF2946 domain-containing protein [Proteobacteria bacterium]|nr:DUF2946 domain-containing protein [Pseudomonadota bacterium]